MPRSVSSPAIAGLEFLTGFTPYNLRLILRFIIHKYKNGQLPKKVGHGLKSRALEIY